MAKSKSKNGMNEKVINLVFLVLLAIGIAFATIGPQQPEPDVNMGLSYAGICMSILFGLLFGYAVIMTVAGKKVF